jgi:hypothetical protein
VPKKPRTGQNKAQRKKGGHPRQAPRQGIRTTHRCPRYNRNRLRQHRELHQVLLHKSKARLRGQSSRWGCAQEGKGTQNTPRIHDH